MESSGSNPSSVFVSGRRRRGASGNACVSSQDPEMEVPDSGSAVSASAVRSLCLPCPGCIFFLNMRLVKHIIYTIRFEGCAKERLPEVVL